MNICSKKVLYLVSFFNSVNISVFNSEINSVLPSSINCFFSKDFVLVEIVEVKRSVQVNFWSDFIFLAKELMLHLVSFKYSR